MKTYLIHFLTVCVCLYVATVGATEKNDAKTEKNVKPFILAEAGKTAWKIVLPEMPSVVEKTAARELGEHLKLVTGADFPTISETELNVDKNSEGNTKRKKLIFVGKTRAGSELVGEKKFQFDEIFIRAHQGNLYLNGHERRGTLYAVYSFLQDTVGVRWWTRTETYIPKKPTLEIPGNLEVSYAPQIISREMYHRWAQPTVFSARMKGNGFLTEEYGGRVDIMYFVHSFNKVLPPEELFEKHPEWYSLIDGKRTGDHSQLCLTNDEMRAEYTRRVLENLRKHPDTKFVDISQNDWHGWCECEKCRAFDEREGSKAGVLLTFINQVAEDIEKEFPDVLVETLAYHQSRKPPKTIRPRDNVLIRLCSIECSFLQPLDGEQNTEFASDIEGWSKIAKHLFIWDYVTNYDDYLGPFPNYYALAPNVRYFVKHGAVGLFEEGEGDDLADMRNWVLLRLMWEPELDENALITEFCDGYYGPEITPFIWKYMKTLVQRAREVDVYLGCFSCKTPKWLDLETLNQATRIMNAAVEKSVSVYGADSVQVQRLRRAKMAVDLVWLDRYFSLRNDAKMQNLPFEGPKNLAVAMADFAEMCEKSKTKSFVIHQEGQFQERIDMMKNYAVTVQNPPEYCTELDTSRWFVFDDALYNNHKNVAERVEDHASIDGKATKMDTRVDWHTSCRPSVQGKYRIFVSMRADATIDKGVAASVGVYDPETKKGALSLTLNVEKLKGTNYRWLDCGVVEFTPTSYIWFAHRHDENVQAVYVDRLILVDEN